jgi:poly(A) polymerase
LVEASTAVTHEPDAPRQLIESRQRFARQVAQRLREAGYEALWAGGCVRDLLLEHPPVDYDVATSARPEQVRSLFGQRRTLAVGAAFGVIIVKGPDKASGQVEVATFRNDSTYSDGRRPDSVTYSTAIEDARRRDFTINGMFYDPLAEQVLDYVGGREDLQRGVIRAIGDADARIAEDKLRMLRAVRFAARFAFAIEPETHAALARHADDLRVVSGERMAAEMRKTLSCHGRVRGAREWAETGLLRVLIPQLAERWRECGPRALALAQAAAPERWEVVLAALLAPLLSGPVEARFVQELKHRLRLANEEADGIEFALQHHFLLANAQHEPWSRIQPLLAQPRARIAVELVAARAGAGEIPPESADWLREKLQLAPEILDPPPLLDGRDLQAAGLQPGPRFRQLLGEARQRQLDAQLVDRTAALAWLRQQVSEPV